MADYRTIDCGIWDDEWFVSLDDDAKVLWFYLITNFRASVAGIYRLPVRTIINETGLGKTRIEALLCEFESADKSFFRDGIVFVKNLRRYQATRSPKVISRIMRDLAEIPDGWLKTKYFTVYPPDENTVSENSDTVSIPSERTNQPTNQPTEPTNQEGTVPGSNTPPARTDAASHASPSSGDEETADAPVPPTPERTTRQRLGKLERHIAAAYQKRLFPMSTGAAQLRRMEDLLADIETSLAVVSPGTSWEKAVRDRLVTKAARITDAGNYVHGPVFEILGYLAEDMRDKAAKARATTPAPASSSPPTPREQPTSEEEERINRDMEMIEKKRRYVREHGRLPRNRAELQEDSNA